MSPSAGLARRVWREAGERLGLAGWRALERLRRIGPSRRRLGRPQLLTWSNFHGSPPGSPAPSVVPLGSGLCRQSDFSLDLYRYWVGKLAQPPRFHRKQWEFVFLAQALWERGCLAPGMRGVGFGVGREPLAALFASFGCTVVATDLEPARARDAGWVASHQNAASLADLGFPEICPPEAFRERVSFQNADMNAIPAHLRDFDFCWSSCAFEHLGSLEHGLRFVHRALDTLKPGGVAVHTTEYNLSSDDRTLESAHLCAVRRRDILALVESLEKEGHQVAPLDLSPGDGLVDRYVDLPPFSRPEPHLKLYLKRFACTSLGLIIRRAG
jgi:SAM-dependent methyltransferase